MCCFIQFSENRLEAENRELTEENAKLESDKEMLEFSNTQLIEEKHQLETSVMQVQAENNQQKTENNQQRTENNQLKTENSQQKTEINQLKSENDRLRKQITDETIQLISRHEQEKLQFESHYHQKRQILQSEVERLTKELERIKTVSIDKKSLVSIVYLFTL